MSMRCIVSPKGAIVKIVLLAEEARTEAMIGALVQLWEASVRPTHLFLSESDIVELRPQVSQALRGVRALAVALGEGGAPEGFLGVEDGKVEMLFVSPASFGQGVGGLLLDYAVEALGARGLDVNEQNPRARDFYEHKGFAVVGRSDFDDQGRPFPLLHMELKRAEDAG